MQNGLLPVVLPAEACELLYQDALAEQELEVDLEKLEVRRPNGQAPISFEGKFEFFRLEQRLIWQYS